MTNPPTTFANDAVLRGDVEQPLLQRWEDGTTLFVPEHYERHYAYPLVLWIDSESNAERAFASSMTAISCRNAFGLRIVTHDGAPPVDDVAACLRRVRRDYNIHTERIVPTGVGPQATAALSLFFRRPEWFAGVACANGDWSGHRAPVIPFRDRGFRGKPAFLSRPHRDDARAFAGATRLLHNAGLNVTIDVACSEWEAGLNAWLIDSICANAASA